MQKEQKANKTMEVKVGRTNFLVNIYHKKDGKETYKDKIARLIKREVEKNEKN